VLAGTRNTQFPTRTFAARRAIFGVTGNGTAAWGIAAFFIVLQIAPSSFLQKMRTLLELTSYIYLIHHLLHIRSVVGQCLSFLSLRVGLNTSFQSQYPIFGIESNVLFVQSLGN
jgi:hypothetical protein